MSVSTDTVREALRSVIDPNLNKDFISAKLIKNIQVDGGDVSFDLELSYPGKSQLDGLRKAAIAAVRSQVQGVENVSVNATIKIQTHAVQRGLKPMPNVKNIIAVASGKGGVGKSTFAVNLACALAQVLTFAGRPGRVGLMDCDIYGPSVPLMMGLSGRPEVEGQGAEAMLVPMERHGVKVISMGFLVDDNTPVEIGRAHV